MELIAHAAPAAAARTGDGRRRGVARHLGVGFIGVPPALRAAAQSIAGIPAPAGRVHGGGAIDCPPARAALIEALGAELRSSLRERLEWYSCRGAFFHTDAHYGEVLFGAWCVSGPRRETVFSRLDRRVAAGPGDVVIFDPFEPHAVLDPGQARYEAARYADAPPSVFVGFELSLTPACRLAFDIGAPRPGAIELSSQRRINAETGALH